MTQTDVNVIGGIVMIALFYYVMIYKPKRLMKKPTDIQPLLKPSNSLKLGEMCYRHFSKDHYVVTQQSFNMLIHSSKLSRNTDFAKELQRLEADAVLVDKATRMPVAAIMLSTKDDERKGALISGIGAGCLIFTHVDDEDEIVNCIQKYLAEQKQGRVLAEAL